MSHKGQEGKTRYFQKNKYAFLQTNEMVFIKKNVIKICRQSQGQINPF